MQFEDYKCTKCEKVIYYRKPHGIDFPETITCDFEEQCDGTGTCERVRGVPVMDVVVGKVGNAKTGYKNENVYKPGSFTTSKSSRTNKYSDPGFYN
jgi:hypothetical protein